MISIAIGIGENKNILKAVDIFKKENSNCNIILIDNEEDLIKAINNENIDAVIRGSLPSNKIIKKIKQLYPNNLIQRATYVKDENHEFLLSPVGIDEGNSIEDKYKLIINCSNFIKKLNKKPKIAILANGRKSDYNRSKEISTSIDESEKLFSLIKKNTSLNIKNYYILIEKAILEKNNIIIAPDGIIGNIIFRTLILINKWPSYGAITFGTDRIYIDTSRDQSIEGYLRSIKLAYKLNFKKV